MQIYLPIAEVSVNAFLLLGLGGLVGVLSGMFGVGGGFLMTPLLFFIGIPPAVAVATEANQIVASSFSAVLAHLRRKTVDLRMGTVLLVGGLIGSALGVWVFNIPQLSGGARFSPIELPFAEALSGVPFIGPLYADALSGHTILVYVGLLTVPLTWYVLFRTRFGLRLRAVGENPGAVDTAGVSVVRLRYAAVAICGVLCGLSGSFLATGLAASFTQNMSAGRGYIALAALIFAKWRPWYALGACLLFGLLQAISNRYSSIDLVLFEIPNAFVLALPYILTVVILAGFVGKAVPPRAGGQPYVKER